jgi:uncharacterized protein affecting Mg2+/Co2+ transport
LVSDLKVWCQISIFDFESQKSRSDTFLGEQPQLRAGDRYYYPAAASFFFLRPIHPLNRTIST